MSEEKPNTQISILGSGWLGVPLAHSFLSSGYTVKLSTRSTDKRVSLVKSASSCHIIDIDNDCYDHDFFDSDLMIINITSKNIDGFKTLLDKISQSSVSKVIFTSSSSVYLNSQELVDETNGPIDKQHPLFQIEQLFRNNSSFQTTIVRLAGLIGGSRHPGYFFKDKAVSSPLAPVNLIHLDDCIGIINRIVEKNYWGETINACADSYPTKKEFYSYVRSLTTLPPLQFASEEINHYKIVSNAKIKTALNYQFIYPDLLQIPFKEK
jgi:nucleoside-diphosphate-sugar epimerase